ncbi:hypothetical protein EVAR_33010_1 [Eumeta japonica]|uniref:Uncharacterized protein n=1 Tax=Eumeta variegata TaxID=151549 RepID=A0A4C1VRG5_EUMVA|nr:hypothetical protein EVAR_33010_1 [Eumeta japonica]
MPYRVPQPTRNPYSFVMYVRRLVCLSIRDSAHAKPDHMDIHKCLSPHTDRDCWQKAIPHPNGSRERFLVFNYCSRGAKEQASHQTVNGHRRPMTLATQEVTSHHKPFLNSLTFLAEEIKQPGPAERFISAIERADYTRTGLSSASTILRALCRKIRLSL